MPLLDQVKIILGIETKGFQQANSTVKSMVEGMQHEVAGLKNQLTGAFTLEAGREFVRAVTEMGERFKDLSQQTGISTDEVQKYDAAFRKVGLTAEDAARAFDLLTQKRKDALAKGGADARLFQAFGVTEDELKNLKTGSEVFDRLARGRSVTNQGDRELFADMFGPKRGGPLLAGASELSGVQNIKLMSEHDIEALDQSAKNFAAAARDFKISASPIVAFLTRLAAEDIGLLSSRKRFAEALVKTAINPIGSVRSLIKTGLGVNDKPGTASEQPSSDPMLEQFFFDPKKAPTAALRKKWSADDKASAASDAAALSNVFLKVSNPEGQKAILRGRMSSLFEQASKEEDSAKADALRAEAIKTAGQLVEIGVTPSRVGSHADSLAAVGGYIGGAARGMDPGLNVQQDMLETLREILKTNGITNELLNPKLL